MASDQVNRGINGRPNEVVNGVVNNCCNAKQATYAVASNAFGGAF